MRITNSLFYTNAANDYQRNMQELYKTNTQISSGMKIQNSFEDSGTYVDTMRLNSEVATLDQAKQSSSKAQTYTKNTDAVFNQFTDSLNQFKTLMIQASNATSSSTSLSAIASELEGLRTHMRSLGNTSINGNFLFSGTATKTKPINADGSYAGNGGSLEAIIGSDVKLPYNMSGKELFLGTDKDYNRTLSTNISMYNQSKLHPDVMVVNSGVTASKKAYLTSNDTIRDLVGDTDNITTNDPNAMFYLSGRKSDGSTFSSKIEMKSNEKVSELLKKIGSEFGNTPTNTVADVKMNEHGQIEVKDLKTGGQLLEMNIFGAVDRNTTAGFVGDASKMTVDDLMSQDNVQIVEFQKSNFKSANTASAISSKQNTYVPGQFTLGAPMQKSDGTPAKTSTKLQSFMGTQINQIDFSGANNNGTIVTDTLAITSSTTVQDLLNKVNTVYGVSARLENGQIYLNGGSSTDFVANKLNATMTAKDSVGVTEVQSFEFKKDATATTAGNMTVAGVTVSIANGDTPSQMATKVVNAITTAGLPHADTNGKNITAISSSNGKVVLTYDIADADVPDVGITNPNSLSIGSVITETQYASPRVINAFSTFDGMNYERRGFKKDGSTLSSNISQTIKSSNQYATASTKLSEVSGVSPLNGTVLELNFTDKNGKIGKGQINLSDTGSTFQVDFDNSGTYEANEIIPLFDTTGVATKAKDVTYQQINDVISLALTNNHPVAKDQVDATGAYVGPPLPTSLFTEYQNSLKSAKATVNVSLNSKGQITVNDKKNSDTKVELSIFDSRSDSFALPTDTAAFSFMANDAVKIEDPTIDFYKSLDNIIKAVKNGEMQMSADNKDPRSLGLNNSLTMINHLMDHVNKSQTKIGAYSNALSQANQRSELLSVNVQTIRSQVIDVDIGKAYMKFNQLSNSYQAMLSTVAKINKMTLLNYM